MGETSRKKELFEWLKILGIGVILAGILNLAFSRIDVNGISMEPTLQNQERVIVNNLKPLYSAYQRFDVVVFKQGDETNYIKRIIGLPGDHVKYENDQLYINGEKYEEPYLEEYKNELTDHSPLTADFTLEELLGESVVPDGKFFVLGDNRRYSIDSRDPEVGFISEDVLIGPASFVLWPMRIIQ